MQPGGDNFSLKAILTKLITIVVAMIMAIRDSTVANIAIRKLVECFDTDLLAIQWTVAGYTLALSAVIPLGRLDDR